MASNSASSAVDYAQFRSRSYDAEIRVHDHAGNVMETQGARGRVQRVVSFALLSGNFGLLFRLALIMTNSRLLFNGSAS